MKLSVMRCGLCGLLVLLSSVTGSLQHARADVRLPGIFGDSMVLQQQMPIHIWGWADPGESIIVSLGDVSVETTTSAEGRWEADLPAQDASYEPRRLVVRGNNAIEIADVLVGEVWLCSGQSNMEWSVARSTNAKQEIAAANHEAIRHIKMPRAPLSDPSESAEANWSVCSPETAGNFTAAGYYMARELQQRLDVPIGLVNSSWGGTRIEPWTPPVGFREVEALKDLSDAVVAKTPTSDAYVGAMTSHVAEIESWLQQAKAALDSNTRVPISPVYPAAQNPYRTHREPTTLYNGMIHPFVGFSIRGAIWYQGEANHNEGMLYADKMKALIQGWRRVWDQGDFPFYFVQIAPYKYGDEDPSILAEFWEAQAAAAKEIANTGMVVINDIATLDNIHPPNKQDVGKRLALLAMRNDYGRSDVVASSPKMASFQAKDNEIRIEFSNTGGGLTTRDGKGSTHFELIGAKSNGFQPAKAMIQGDQVVLTSPDVVQPTAFRFAWDKLAQPNLTGSTGLPVGAFRGGEVPSFFSAIPGNADYELVYDLDLSRLGTSIEYDIDRSGEIDSFDRVGYLIQLGNDASNIKQVFVSMDAFTDDVTKIAIPTTKSGAHFQQSLESMDVYSSVPEVTAGKSLSSGVIEFWPNNYGAGNDAGVANASSAVFDFGDSPGPPVEGYGSMQIHNADSGQTLFAINHWSAGASADLGIGSSTGQTKDWTFTRNAGTYNVKRLRVYVQPKSD